MQKNLINILYISSFGRLRSGGQISLWNLLTRLDRSKFNPILICPEKGDFLSSCQEIGIPAEIVALPSFSFWNLTLILTSLLRLAKIIKKYQADVVHTDDLRQILYFRILKPFFRFYLIWHIRVGRKNVFLDTLGFYFSNKIICTAKIIAEKFQHLPGYKQKVKLVYNAIDYNYFAPVNSSPEIRKRYNIDTQDFVIGVVSRLHPEKGIHFLIEAFPQIQKVIKNTKLIIVGDGEEKYKQSLEQRVEELRIRDFVTFTGFQKDVRPFLNMSDLFILPTMEKEGSSRSILEAMASGIPVLTTDSGGNSELVEDGITGIIVSQPDPLVIAKEAIQLFSQKERLTQMGQEARNRIIKKFAILQNVKLIEDIYLSLLSA